MNIIKDVKTVVSLFGEVRKARINGSEIKTQCDRKLPLYVIGGILNTVEGCSLINHDKSVFNIAQKAFNTLPGDVRDRMMNSPKDSEYSDRVQFWRELLRPVMSEKQYHTAMGTIIAKYIRIKRSDLRKTA